MLLDVENYIEVAGWPTKHAGLAVSAEANAGAIFHSGRYFSLDGALTQHAALSLALWAWVGDDAAHALAGGAGARHRKESLLIANLSASLAGTAGYRRLSWCGA